MSGYTIHVSHGSPIDTLAKALSLLPPDDGTPAVIHLAPGLYREKAIVSRAHTTIEGAGAAHTRIVWDDAARTILADGRKRGTFRTATLRTDAPDITLRGLTIENAAAPREAVGQAIALYADGDGLLVEDCALLGAQDTLFTAPLPPREIEKDGFIGPKQFAPRVPQRQLYRRCRIEGDVDFIFGGAAAWPCLRPLHAGGPALRLRLFALPLHSGWRGGWQRVSGPPVARVGPGDAALLRAGRAHQPGGL